MNDLKENAAIMKKAIDTSSGLCKGKMILGTCSKLVLFYGLFTVGSAIVQCIIPFVSLLAAKAGYDGLFATLLNIKYKVPMSVIAWGWTTLCSIYIGVDRTLFAISSSQTAFNSPDIGHPERLKLIVWESFGIYCIAAILNLIFDADLQLEPLAAAFVSSILLFTAGQKAINAVNKLAKNIDIDEDGIDDSLQDPNEVLGRLKDLLKKSGNLADEDDLDGDGIKDSEENAADVINRIKLSLRTGNKIVTN